MRSLVGRSANSFQLALGFACAAALAAGASAPARADNPLLDGSPATMRERPLLEGRHLVAPTFGVTIGDPYARNLLAGIQYRYHLTPWLGIGVDVFAGGAVTTALTDDIERELSRDGAPFQLSETSLRAIGNLTIELVPLTGKAMLFSDALVRWDLHFIVGIGAAMIAGDGRIDDSVSIAPMFGVGMRFFPSQWLSVGLELRDYIIDRALASRKDGSVPGSTFGHNWMFGLSIGFSFPTAPSAAD